MLKLLLYKAGTLLSDSSVNLALARIMVNASSPFIVSFVAGALAVAGAFVAAVHLSAIRTGRSPREARRDTLVALLTTATWLGLTLGLAATGHLSFTSVPPTEGIVIAASLALGVWVGASRLGYRIANGIPLAALVGVQGFRFPLELMLHRAYIEGLMPVQMSYAGLNFDILSGLSAIVVAVLLVRRPALLGVVRIWNVGGALLLVNILTIAVLSTPTPLRVFHNEPANEWIAHAPWVWLPAVYVVAAIIGHVLVFRRLRHESRLATRPEARGTVAPSAAVS